MQRRSQARYEPNLILTQLFQKYFFLLTYAFSCATNQSRKAKFGSRTLFEISLYEVIDKLCFIMYNISMQKILAVFNIVILVLLVCLISFILLGIKCFDDDTVLPNHSTVAYAETDSYTDNKENELADQKKETTDLRGWITITISVLALVISVFNLIHSILKERRTKFEINKVLFLEKLNKFYSKALEKSPTDIDNHISCKTDTDFQYAFMCEMLKKDSSLKIFKDDFEDFCTSVDNYLNGTIYGRQTVEEKYNILYGKIENLQYTRNTIKKA